MVLYHLTPSLAGIKLFAAVAVIGLCLVVAFVLLLLCCAKRMSRVAERRFHIKITVEPFLRHATVRCFPVLLCAICVLNG